MHLRAFWRGCCTQHSPGLLLALALLGLCAARAQRAAGAEVPGPAAVVLSIEGRVEILPRGGKEWQPARVGQALGAGYALRTGRRSRALLRLSNLSVLRVGELMEYQLEPPRAAGGKPVLNLKAGSAYLFSRDKPRELELHTPVATGAIRGTEFNVTVAADGQTRLTMIEGEVELSSPEGTVSLRSGEEGVVAVGGAPVKTAVLHAVNVVQWNLYYPGVLDPAELGLDEAQRQALADSLAAYRNGNLPDALKQYPATRQPTTAAERVFLGGLLLAVGLVDESDAELKAATPATGDTARLADALRQVVAAVKLQPWEQRQPAVLASEWLAESYYQQSRAHLEEALAAARKAVEKSPAFGFGWERVAELEFAFGRTATARAALEHSLELAPTNAQAVALKGFLLSADNHTAEAIGQFDHAIELDGALGNAWLGRGLCRIRQGHLDAGRDDLEAAAALEPNRAVLRSYLGKAFNETGDYTRAAHELALSRRFDPGDPTSLLYSALLNQQGNRINQAIRELEQSEALNDNRAVYRSRLLLDQDAAVRGANLASIYLDAGMDDVSVREATRAVNYDYANFSAHYFLANSYNALRDPEQINLRYETPWLSEYLLANLLAPVGARTLSQNVSQQEYSKLFERDALGVASMTEYRSRGDWRESGTQYGNVGNLGYAVDANYLSETGQRPNNDQQQLTLSVQLKYDLTPQDSFYLQTVYYDASGGDLAEYYNQANANPLLRTKENQEPLLLAGYHHEWNPEMHTLVLVGRFDDENTVTDPAQPILLLAKDGTGQVIAQGVPTASLNYDSHLDIYSAEVQQLWEHERHTVVVGGRYQTGWFTTGSGLGQSTPTHVSSTTATSIIAYSSPPNAQEAKPELERWTGYGYYNWRVVDPLILSAGVAYDYLRFPVNYRNPPLLPSEDSEDQISPKAGFTWTPWRDTVVHFAYTRSLGGVSFDQSVRLEPSQVAGFNQAFRSLIPESVEGSTSGAKFETFGLALEQKFPTGTYVGIQGELLNSDVRRVIGAVDLLFPPTFVPSSTRQTLDYQEKNLTVTVNQLLDDWWSLGVRYRVSQAHLATVFPDIPLTVTTAAQAQNEAILHQVTLFALLNHSSGFFSRAEAVWYMQSNGGYQPALAGDDFWQINLFAGYRFLQRRAQVQVGVLNLTDRDYQLNPLNLYPDLPRQRTFLASLQFNF